MDPSPEVLGGIKVVSRGMRILVTGAGGFVGGHLITNLHRAGHEVIAASHRPWEPPVPVEIDVFDVRDGDRFRAVMDARRPEAVIHLAAQASVRRSWEASDETFAVNVTGTSHLLEALTDRPETRVLLVGSAQQYGLAAAGRPLVETDPLQPRSPYGVSKVAQELVGALYRRHFGLRVLVARPFNHTGPGQSTEYAIGAFSAQVAEIERGDREPRLKVGWLESRRDYLDVRDVADAYRLLVEAGADHEVGTKDCAARWKIQSGSTAARVWRQEVASRMSISTSSRSLMWAMFCFGLRHR